MFHWKSEIRSADKACGVCLTFREWLLGAMHSVRQKVKFLLTKRNKQLCEPKEYIFTSKTTNLIWISYSWPIGQAKTTTIVWKDYPSRRCRQRQTWETTPSYCLLTHLPKQPKYLCHNNGILGTFSFKITFFLMWTILVFIEFIRFITILLLFLCFGIFGPRSMWNISSLTRDQTPTLCIGRWSFNHLLTRKVLVLFLYFPIL